MNARNWLERRLREDSDEFIDLVQQMVRIPSETPPGDTTDIAAFVGDYLDQSNAPYEVVDPEPTMPNIVGTIEGNDPGKHLVLNGHLDVFPAGDPAAWIDDPYSAIIRDGKLYGRGVSDMKAGTAASILTYCYLNQVREHWQGKLTLTAVSDEESFGPYGSRYLIEHRPDVRGDALLNAEPSTPYSYRFAEKGPCWLELLVETAGGHGGYPQVSPNAVKITADIIREVEGFSEIRIQASPEIVATIEDNRDLLARMFGEGTADVLSRVTVNIGLIEGGDKVNMIARECRTEFDFRTPVGVPTDLVIERFAEVVSRYPDASYRVINRSEPNHCDPNTELARIIQDNAETVRGIRPRPVISMGGTDARLWRYEGIPAYVYGPTPYNMGAPDEYVTLDDLLGTVQVHVLTAFDYLSQ